MVLHIVLQMKNVWHLSYLMDRSTFDGCLTTTRYTVWKDWNWIIEVAPTEELKKGAHNRDTKAETHLDWVGEILFAAVLIDFLK